VYPTAASKIHAMTSIIDDTKLQTEKAAAADAQREEVQAEIAATRQNIRLQEARGAVPSSSVRGFGPITGLIQVTKASKAGVKAQGKQLSKVNQEASKVSKSLKEATKTLKEVSKPVHDADTRAKYAKFQRKTTHPSVSRKDLSNEKDASEAMDHALKESASAEAAALGTERKNAREQVREEKEVKDDDTKAKDAENTVIAEAAKTETTLHRAGERLEAASMPQLLKDTLTHAELNLKDQSAPHAESAKDAAEADKLQRNLDAAVATLDHVARPVRVSQVNGQPAEPTVDLDYIADTEAGLSTAKSEKRIQADAIRAGVEAGVREAESEILSNPKAVAASIEVKLKRFKHIESDFDDKKLGEEAVQEGQWAALNALHGADAAEQAKINTIISKETKEESNPMTDAEILKMGKDNTLADQVGDAMKKVTKVADQKQAKIQAEKQAETEKLDTQKKLRLEAKKTAKKKAAVEDQAAKKAASRQKKADIRVKAADAVEKKADEQVEDLKKAQEVRKTLRSVNRNQPGVTKDLQSVTDEQAAVAGSLKAIRAAEAGRLKHKEVDDRVAEGKPVPPVSTQKKGKALQLNEVAKVPESPEDTSHLSIKDSVEAEFDQVFKH